MTEKKVFADHLKEASRKLTGEERDFVGFVIRRERAKRFDRRDDLPGQFAAEAAKRTKPADD